jgi:hypothetical protein
LHLVLAMALVKFGHESSVKEEGQRIVKGELTTCRLLASSGEAVNQF